jgi:putative flavoprotein involved in K+ transport
VNLLGGFERADGAVVQIAGNLMENAALGDGFSAQIKGMIDQAIAASGMEAPAAEPDPAEAPFDGMAEMAERRTLDLKQVGIGTVIWATGFRGDYSYLDVPALDEQGTPEHEDGISRVPGLYFLGFPWLRTRASGLITGIDADVRFLVEHLRARGD